MQSGYTERVLGVTRLHEGHLALGGPASPLLEIIKAFNLLQGDVLLE